MPTGSSFAGASGLLLAFSLGWILPAAAAEDVFVDALKQSATSLGESVVNIVTNPVEVAKSTPEGVGRFFGRVGRPAKTAAQKLGDVAEARQPGAPRGAAASPNSPNIALASGVAAGKAARDILGYDVQRRQLARALSMSMLAKEHASTPFASLLSGKSIGITEDGRAIATASVDYVCWGEGRLAPPRRRLPGRRVVVKGGEHLVGDDLLHDHRRRRADGS